MKGKKEMRLKAKKVTESIEKCTVGALAEILKRQDLPAESDVVIQYKPNNFVTPAYISGENHDGNTVLVLTLPYEMLDDEDTQEGIPPKDDRKSPNLTDEELKKLSPKERVDYGRKKSDDVYGWIKAIVDGEPAGPTIIAMLRVIMDSVHSAIRYLEKKSKKS